MRRLLLIMATTCSLMLAASFPAQPALAACDGGVRLGVRIGGKDCVGSSGQNPIYAYLELIINWAVKLLGAALVLAIVISGFQYVTSGGSPDAIKAAKGRLFQAVIGLVLFMLMAGILAALGINVLG